VLDGILGRETDLWYNVLYCSSKRYQEKMLTGA